MLEISQKDGEFKGGKNRFAEREQSKCEIYFELVMSEELTDFFNVQLLFICLCLYKYTKLSLNPLQNSPGGQGDGPWVCDDTWARNLTTELQNVKKVHFQTLLDLETIAPFFFQKRNLII